MKRWLLALLILVSTTANAVDYDKKLHFGASTTISALTYVYTESWETSLSVCMTIGVAKELYDEYDYGGFDTKDLIFDAAGCVIGVIVGSTALSLYRDDDIIFLNYSWKW